jgi:phage terminase small subunit
VPIALPDAKTPLAFLLSVMNDNAADPALRVKAATSAAQYMHTRRQDGGKKDEQLEAAKGVAAGKFGARPSPLKLVNKD